MVAEGERVKLVHVTLIGDFALNYEDCEHFAKLVPHAPLAENPSSSAP